MLMASLWSAQAMAAEACSTTQQTKMKQLEIDARNNCYNTNDKGGSSEGDKCHAETNKKQDTALKQSDVADAAKSGGETHASATEGAKLSDNMADFSEGMKKCCQYVMGSVDKFKKQFPACKTEADQKFSKFKDEVALWDDFTKQYKQESADLRKTAQGLGFAPESASVPLPERKPETSLVPGGDAAPTQAAKSDSGGTSPSSQGPGGGGGGGDTGGGGGSESGGQQGNPLTGFDPSQFAGADRGLDQFNINDPLAQNRFEQEAPRGLFAEEDKFNRVAALSPTDTEAAMASNGGYPSESDQGGGNNGSNGSNVNNGGGSSGVKPQVRGNDGSARGAGNTQAGPYDEVLMPIQFGSGGRGFGKGGRGGFGQATGFKLPGFQNADLRGPAAANTATAISDPTFTRHTQGDAFDKLRNGYIELVKKWESEPL